MSHGEEWFRCYAIAGVGVPIPSRSLPIADGFTLHPMSREVAPAALEPRAQNQHSRTYRVIHRDLQHVVGWIEVADDISKKLGMPGHRVMSIACTALQLYGFLHIRSPFASKDDLALFSERKTLVDIFPWKNEGAMPHQALFDGTLPAGAISDEVRKEIKRELSTIRTTEWEAGVVPFVVQAIERCREDGRLVRIFKIIDQHRFVTEPSFAVAGLWAGIEAFLNPPDSGDTAEALAIRLPLAGAMYLGDETSLLNTFDLYHKLYHTRSRVVHGDEVGQDEMARALVDSYKLLHQLLRKAVTDSTARVRSCKWDQLIKRLISTGFRSAQPSSLQEGKRLIHETIELLSSHKI